jgi:hypothetical protein
MTKTKTPPPGKCVHCLKNFDNLTWDHVFPKAWYPDTTPPNLEKWKIPACFCCNHEYGKLEEDLLWRLGLSINPEDRKSLGITDKILRATNPLFAKNGRDKKFRTEKLKSIIRQLMEYGSMPKEGILPNFGPQPGLNYEGIGEIPILEDSLPKLGRKIVRGITYLFESSFIDDSYKINVLFLEDNKAQDVLKAIEAKGTIHDQGPGIVVKHAKANEGGLSSIWLIEIWGKLKMYAVVMPSLNINKSDT